MFEDNTRASLTLLYNISRELASITDLRTTLARVLLLAVQTVGAERGSLVVLDAAQQPVDAALVYKGQVLPHTFEQLKDILDRGLAGRVYRNREPVLITDTRHDPRWLLRPDDAEEQSGAKSAICVPVVEHEMLLGVLTIVHPVPQFFTQEHLSLVQAVADLASIAVRNAQLYDSLNEARRRYYELFEDSIDPIFITDWDGKIVEANRQAEQTTGHAREDLCQMRVFDLYPLGIEQAAHDDRSSREKIQAGQVVSFETDLVAKNGRRLPVQVQVHVRQVHFAATQNLQWIARDISERKHFEALREDLSSMIYHDLRSPLSNVFSSLEMMESLLPAGSNPALNQVVNIALRSTERVQRLINSLLDIRRLEAGQPITTRRWIEVSKLFEDVLGFVQSMVANKHQHLVLELDSGRADSKDFPPVWVDGDMIRRVLVNLLENAGKFTAEGGSLYAGARLRKKEILFWVRDTGAGISPEIQEKIFDKFVSVQSGNTGRLPSMPKGLGLGLAFCRLAVQAHGGKIWVESEPEKGSTFFFTLPLGQP